MHIDATIAGHPVTSEFTPPLVFQLDATALRLAQSPAGAAQALHPSRPGTLRGQAEVPATVDMFGMRLDVVDTRGIALLVGFFAAAGAWLAYLVLRRSVRSDVDRIALRYGRLLVPASNASQLTQTPIVDLTSIDDLARVAEQSNALIVHRSTDHGHVYVCFADLATYRFVAGAPTAAVPATPWRPEPPVHAPGPQPEPQMHWPPQAQGAHHN
jgi:hypothetical protein